MLFILTVLSVALFFAVLLVIVTLINIEKYSKKMSISTEKKVGKVFSILLREEEKEK